MNNGLRLIRTEPREAQVLKSILEYLRHDRRVAWAHRFNTGAYVVGTGSNRRYIRYGFPGCPDILGQLTTGHVLAVEVKRPSRRNSASLEQRQFLQIVNANGGLGLVAASVDEVRGALDNFLH